MSARMVPSPQPDQHDPIALIEGDHRLVDALFEHYERLGAEGDSDERRRTVHSIIEELRLHAAIEEQLLYPAIQEALGEPGDELVEKSLLEHAEAKETLDEIEALDVTTHVFHERVTALIEEVRHHVDEEEQELLPKLREALDSQVLERLAEEPQSAKLTLLGIVAGQEAEPAPGIAAGGSEEGVVIGDAGTYEQPQRVTPKTAPTARPKPKKATAKKATSSRSTAKKPAAKKPSTSRSGGKTASRSTARLQYHVTPTSTGRWAVAQKGAARPSATFDRKPEAVS